MKESAGQAMAGWMQEIVPYGIFTTDRELRVETWNDWMVTHSGLRAPEVLGRRLTEIYPDLEARRILPRYMRALEGEVSLLSAALHKYLLAMAVTIAESGLPHMLQTARIAPLPGADGVAGTITIIEDVTQRQVQAAVLNRQQELDRLLSGALATLLQSTDPAAEIAGIFGSVRLVLGLDGYVCHLLGADDRTLALHTSAGISPKQRATLATLPLSAKDTDSLRSGGPPHALNIASHADVMASFGIRGQWAFPLAVGDRIIGLLAFGSYERESISLHAIGVLGRIARYVAIALDRDRREREMIAASRAKDDFLAALSHELRTPLNPVLLVASDALMNPDYPEEAREAFRVIEKNALLEARLIDDLLDLTRIAHGKLGLEKAPLDVNAVLRDALETVRTDMIERRLALRIDLAAGERAVNGDSDRLRQVFWNVVKNAVKFTPAGGHITVASSVNAAGDQIAISVTDTGIGMDAPELARIFGAFAQGDHAERGRSHRFGGLGLGLAISRKLVEMHGGRIEAASAGKGLGCTFTIFLPLAESAVPEEAPSAGKTEASGRDAPSGAGVAPRILLVEDHEPTRASLVQLLERRGYAVTAVAFLQSALDEAARGPFSLVLSDIGLPDGNGFELMRKLRDTYGLKGIALTGYGMEEDLVKSGDAGFFAHLTKPISVKVLDRTLEKVFQHRGP